MSFLSTVTDWVPTRNPRCAIQWLAAWARGRALTGDADAYPVPYWQFVSGAALAYAHVRSLAHVQDDQAIVYWLTDLAGRAGTKGANGVWSGLAAAAAGAVAKDGSMLSLARRQLDAFLTAEPKSDGLSAAVMIAALLGIQHPQLDKLVDDEVRKLLMTGEGTADWLPIYNRNAYLFQNTRICKLLQRQNEFNAAPLGGNTMSQNPLERLTYSPTCPL